MTNTDFLDEIKKLKNLSDIGLLYCSNEYEKERYLELRNISFKLMSKVSGQNIDALKSSFSLVTEYPTAKVDIRGVILSNEGKVLLVKEIVDGKWALPGGWGDVGYSPNEVIIKEFKEETGLDVIPKRLLAVFDKRKHSHPPQPFYIYKMVIYCETISHEINKGHDVLDVKYFDIDNLPELSKDRILKSQIELVYKKILLQDLEAYLD